jgi:pyruvate ferredoxin oxidoreductase gamma subunit
MKEIKIIGRGGQGAKSASVILAEAALEKGYYIQAFPEYGAERMGAPVYAYTRIDEKEIRIHTGITTPDVVVVIDQTLLNLPVTDGLKDSGILIINTPHTPAEVRKKLNFNKGQVFTVDASQISRECFGAHIPNTPMIGAIEKATHLFGIDSLKQNLREKFLRKIGEQGVQKNIMALERAYNEVIQG